MFSTEAAWIKKVNYTKISLSITPQKTDKDLMSEITFWVLIVQESWKLECFEFIIRLLNYCKFQYLENWNKSIFDDECG